MTASDRVADNIRAIRRVRGLSREDLALLVTESGLTMTSAMLTNIESGRVKGRTRRRMVTVDELCAFSAALSVPPLKLLEDSPSAILRTQAQMLLSQAEAIERGDS